MQRGLRDVQSDSLDSLPTDLGMQSDWTASLSNHLPAFIFQWPWLGRSPGLEHSQVLLEGGLDVSLVSVMQLLPVILKVIFLIKTLSD